MCLVLAVCLVLHSANSDPLDWLVEIVRATRTSTLLTGNLGVIHSAFPGKGSAGRTTVDVRSFWCSISQLSL